MRSDHLTWSPQTIAQYPLQKGGRDAPLAQDSRVGARTAVPGSRHVLDWWGKLQSWRDSPGEKRILDLAQSPR